MHDNTQWQAHYAQQEQLRREREARASQVLQSIDTERLKYICELHETRFGDEFGLEHKMVHGRKGSDFYYYQDNGADVLYVAHLDTVVDHHWRETTISQTTAGPVVHSGALDDRLGAYVGLELLPSLGLKHDILLTVGEEQGASTAGEFDVDDWHDREYHWIIEFDRGGTDVVMYDYEDKDTKALVQKYATVGTGSFTDICMLEHLEVKGFNWGVGYQGNYHSVRGFAFLDDTAMMVEKYMRFYADNYDEYLPHDYRQSWWRGFNNAHGGGWQSDFGDNEFYSSTGSGWYTCDDKGCDYDGTTTCWNCGMTAQEAATFTAEEAALAALAEEEASYAADTADEFAAAQALLNKIAEEEATS